MEVETTLNNIKRGLGLGLVFFLFDFFVFLIYFLQFLGVPSHLYETGQFLQLRPVLVGNREPGQYGPETGGTSQFCRFRFSSNNIGLDIGSPAR